MREREREGGREGGRGREGRGGEGREGGRERERVIWYPLLCIERNLFKIIDK